MSSTTVDLIKSSDAKWVDLHFSDSHGAEHHVSIPSRVVLDEADEFFAKGKAFDGSSISGYQGIENSDMILMPDDSTAVLDPFTDASTVVLNCFVETPDGESYQRDARGIARRAEEYLRSSGIADTSYFGPEPEFFVFDEVRWGNQINRAHYDVVSYEGAWTSSQELEDGNRGHRPGVKGGYFPVPPADSLHDLRTAMCEALEAMDITVEVHHHEVATAGQGEIGTKYNTLLRKADEVGRLKYCVKQVADQWGKTATFMPKPLVGDNGNGMHCHQSLFKDGKNLFDGDLYGKLSQTALHYIGGIIKHAKAVNAFTNSTTNSYRRLVPGFEAPNFLVYSARNRSAAIRIPVVGSGRARRIEVRFPDSAGNPYLSFAALLMAGLDGIRNQIDPGEPQDIDLYEAPESTTAKFPKVAEDLDDALNALDQDRGFLLEGGVFSEDSINGYLEMKREQVSALRQATHPLEFDLYYSC